MSLARNPRLDSAEAFPNALDGTFEFEVVEAPSESCRLSIASNLGEPRVWLAWYLRVFGKCECPFGELPKVDDNAPRCRLWGALNVLTDAISVTASQSVFWYTGISEHRGTEWRDAYLKRELRRLVGMLCDRDSFEVEICKGRETITGESEGRLTDGWGTARPRTVLSPVSKRSKTRCQWLFGQLPGTQVTEDSPFVWSCFVTDLLQEALIRRSSDRKQRVIIDAWVHCEEELDESSLAGQGMKLAMGLGN